MGLSDSFRQGESFIDDGKYICLISENGDERLLRSV